SRWVFAGARSRRRPRAPIVLCVRVALTHKFVVGALIVGGAVVGVPSLLTRSGVDVAPWVAPFVALGAGGAIGYFLSRSFGETFEALSAASDQISRGDLRPLRHIHPQPPLPPQPSA